MKWNDSMEYHILPIIYVYILIYADLTQDDFKLTIE